MQSDTMRRRPSIRALLVSLALLLTPLAADDRAPAVSFMRGMVVSCPRGGQIWGSPAMAEALEQMEPLGIDWVAIHPYARVGRDGEVLWRPVDESGYLSRANEMVRAAGMRLFWKPHLGYWGHFEWRGAIEFDDEVSWSRFFTGYRGFILEQARFAESIGAEIFAIGVELEMTTQRPEWRQLIQEVRQVYSGQLTYAANWDRLDRVPFWNELDLIGVHAYFPISYDDSPTPGALEEGWRSALDELGRVSAANGNLPVFFAEIGYNRSAKAASEPWDNRMDDSPTTRRLRQELMQIAIRSIDREPLVTGMFWWKWIPGPTGHDRDFSMKDEEAQAVLRAEWGVGR